MKNVIVKRCEKCNLALLRDDKCWLHGFIGNNYYIGDENEQLGLFEWNVIN